MESIHLISPAPLSIPQLKEIFSGKGKIGLSADSKTLIRESRDYLDRKLDDSEEVFYGINTGFGSLCDIRISPDEIGDLQRNLMMSHACGMGNPVPPEVIRLMLFLKIQSLAYGHSGVQPALVERLVDFYNHDVLPVIYQQGSLGASGDLAPLAHLGLPLIGMGEVWHNGERKEAAAVLKLYQWEPLALQSKEGLAVLNGTQFCAAYGVWCLIKSLQLANIADLVAAVSVDAFNCLLSPFDERLHRIRPHQGQIDSAARIRQLLEGSEIATAAKDSVQDPYAFRCIPQVHGASRQAIRHVEQIFHTEINSVTDNPNIFPDSDAILSGGNFHAQPLALALDYLGIALAELASISERRIFQLISGKRRLPPFLTRHAGLQSGMMIPQYTAASIVSQNKQLCTPASVDSIVSSNGQEDHVSMGANAATKTYTIVENVERVLAIELFTAAQALEFRRPLRSSEMIENFIADYRNVVPSLDQDRILSIDMEKSVAFLKELEAGS